MKRNDCIIRVPHPVFHHSFCNGTVFVHDKEINCRYTLQLIAALFAEHLHCDIIIIVMMSEGKKG